MNVEKETLAILFLIGIVLVPLWGVSLQSMETQHRVVLSEEKKIAPGERFLPTPVEINEFAAGVMTWIGLFVLVGMIFYTHQFIRTVGQSGEPAADEGGEPVAADGGPSHSLPSFLLTEDRRLADYWPARVSTPGMIGVMVMSWSSLVFSALFAMEALTYARTQFLGVYGGMLFLSLGVLVAVYATWFLPSIHVVEEREHEEKIAGEDEGEGDREREGEKEKEEENDDR